MRLKTIADPAWLRAAAVIVNDLALWMHYCGAIGMYPIGAAPAITTLCATCETKYGRWRPVLIEADSNERAPASLAEDEERMALGLRIAPGNTHRSRVWRWRHLDTGEAYSELPAHVNVGDPSSRWVREVAVRGTTQGQWWPADSDGPL